MKASNYRIRKFRQTRRKAFRVREKMHTPRENFQQRLESWEKVRKNQNKAYVVTMDLARFHSINKRFSYEMGDKVLQYVYHLLSQHSPHGCYWMRQGSDIFIALILNMESNEDMEKLIHYWKCKIESPFVIDGFEFMLTAVFGASRWPEDGANFFQLMKSSDVALRQTKYDKTSWLKWYDPIFRDRIITAFELERQIRIAIQKKEFELYYQPQWDVKNNRWGGLEVLVRWMHPSRGLISPDKFLDIAEETGLIHPLGDWIIREACEQHVIRQKEMGCSDLPLAINFSIKQLMTPNFLDKLIKIIRGSGMKLEHFVMELTESIAIDVEKAKALLTKAKKHGIKISIDDFGTGYSALSYFLELPIDELKIDRSFIMGDVYKDEKMGKLLHWIVQLRNVLDIDIVAEGVETKEQFDLLKEWGCDKIQGFYLSKPISSNEIKKFLKKVCFD